MSVLSVLSVLAVLAGGDDSGLFEACWAEVRA